MRTLLMLLLVGLLGCASPKYIPIHISGSEAPSKIKVLGEFSLKDYQDARKALELIAYLAPELTFTNSPKISWIDSDEFAGITFITGRKEIFIDKEFKVKKDSNLEYFKLGVVICHEMCHFERGMSEQEVQGVSDNRLLLISQNEYQKILNWRPK